MPNPDEAIPPPTLDPGLIYRDQTQPRNQPPAPDPDNPTWGIGGALLVWFASILLVLVMPLVFLVPYAWSRIDFSRPDSSAALVELLTTDKTAILLQLLALLPSHVITFLLVWALVTRFGKQSFWKAIGWEWPRQYRWWVDLLASVLLGIVLFVVGNVIAKLLGAETPTQLEQIINSSLAARYTIAFLAVFTAPFVEEFIYRGVLYSALRKTVGVYSAVVLRYFFAITLDRHIQDRVGVSGAVVVVLALFTAIHVPQYWPNVGVIAAVALLSIALTLIRAYSGRLLPCVVIHFVFNGIQAVLLVLEPFVRRYLPTTEPVAPTAGLLLSLINSCF